MMDENLVGFYKIIGKSIKEKGQEKNLSQQQLADLAGKIDRSQISDLENGKEDFLFSTLLKLSLALGIKISEIMENKEDLNFYLNNKLTLK